MKYEAGFYVNKNTVDGSTDYDNKHNNLYVRHNKIYLFEKSVETNYEAHNATSSARTRGDFIALDFGDGIEEVNGGAGMMMSPEGVYDMQGRRIASGQAAEDGTWRKDVRPGVYIVNGRKIVIR